MLTSDLKADYDGNGGKSLFLREIIVLLFIRGVVKNCECCTESSDEIKRKLSYNSLNLMINFISLLVYLNSSCFLQPEEAGSDYI